jgi:hypothetical protein
MEYNGRYEIFDVCQINTYPVKERNNKIAIKCSVKPDEACTRPFPVPERTSAIIKHLAQTIISSRKLNRPVIFFTGAHLVKNGLGGLLVDLVKKNMITLVAGNGATAIHDFELSMLGETSENVPQALKEGKFGMASELSYINTALELGNRYKLGCGESLGKMMCDDSFRSQVCAMNGMEDSAMEFPYHETSVLATCYEKSVPFTMHTGIGTDVIDQHPSFDGQVKGGCSGRDFLIYVQEVSKLTNGGVVLNVGSAVTGPEVLLKAVSMAGNTGKAPRGIITADFDLRKHKPGVMADESSPDYYFRDQKSVVIRIPAAFSGEGYYIEGNLKQTIPLLYQKIIRSL